jgi:TRAP-type C4-dicarboxylate transport system permease small subunit
MYRLSGLVGIISAVGYIAIIVLCVVDVFVEKLANAPIIGSYEMVERCMIVAVFTSFAYAQAKKAHINMPILIERFPRILRLITLGLTSVVSTGISFYLGYAAFQQFRDATQLNNVTGILKIPHGPFYLVESIAMFLFGLVLVIDTIVIFGALKSDRLNQEVNEGYGLANMKDL